MVEVMSKTIYEKDIAKTILRRYIVNKRLLKSSELQQALILDMGETVGSIEKSVESLCGQLVSVKKNGALQMKRKGLFHWESK